MKEGKEQRFSNLPKRISICSVSIMDKELYLKLWLSNVFKENLFKTEDPHSQTKSSAEP